MKAKDLIKELEKNPEARILDTNEEGDTREIREVKHIELQDDFGNWIKAIELITNF